jgi:hypothetical protein
MSLNKRQRTDQGFDQPQHHHQQQQQQVKFEKINMRFLLISKLKFILKLKSYSRNNESNSSGGNGGGMSNKPQPSFVVHARNLAESVSEFDVRKALERYGIIK